MATTATRVKIEVGQMLVGTWGHEQTNASFFEVLKIKAGFATLVEYRTERTESRPLSMCGTTVPTILDNSKPCIRRKIHAPEWADAEFCRVESYMTVRPWDGRPVQTSWYA